MYSIKDNVYFMVLHKTVAALLEIPSNQLL